MITDHVGAFARKPFTLHVTLLPSISTASLPAGTAGAPYTQALEAGSGVEPFSWSLKSGSLPSGLFPRPSSGAITGTPAAAVTSNFTAKVTDDSGATASKALSLTINAALHVTTSAAPADTVGVDYSLTLAATGGTAPLAWSIDSGNLPDGLELDPGTGAITGTPTASGTFDFTALVTDNAGGCRLQGLLDLHGRRARRQHVRPSERHGRHRI